MMKLKKRIKLALNRAENADLNIIVKEPKSVDISRFFRNFDLKKVILVVNKTDLGIDNINNELNKFNPIYISINVEKNLDKLINSFKEIFKNNFIY